MHPEKRNGFGCRLLPNFLPVIWLLLLFLPACRHAGYSVTVKNIEEKSNGPIYSISAAMPQIAQLPDSGIQQSINQTIAYYVQSQVQQFKEDIAQTQLYNNAPREATNKPAGELTIETTTGLQNKNMVSVKVSTLYHNTGAAYPEYLERCFTFDTRNGEMLTLDRLFVPGTPYLKMLADYVQPLIIEQQNSSGYPADTAQIKKATEPIPANYNTWLLHPDRISFFFPYYKISAQHQPDVWAEVPYHVVKPYLLKQYRW
ncbi:DUF3298 domain-containing protein [Sphingobacteriales bacterium UPWRP_1]|nr:hypothetical protein BVG80_00200 [Sphingobacteriales bacterium TSM_CSM]PSJ71805.1 DUF3298 domain-containing protein [Sphingobacteriales bacterium UPWRP_1]